jgi:hypothetical protein
VAHADVSILRGLVTWQLSWQFDDVAHIGWLFVGAFSLVDVDEWYVDTCPFSWQIIRRHVAQWRAPRVPLIFVHVVV